MRLTSVVTRVVTLLFIVAFVFVLGWFIFGFSSIIVGDDNLGGSVDSVARLIAGEGAGSLAGFIAALSALIVLVAGLVKQITEIIQGAEKWIVGWLKSRRLRERTTRKRGLPIN